MIVVYGKNEEILETLKRILEKQYNQECNISTELECLNHKLSSHPVDIIILSCGIGQGEIDSLYHMVDNRARIIHHYGGGSGLLKSEIEICRLNQNPSSCIISNNQLL
jgi:hypothetical protein